MRITLIAVLFVTAAWIGHGYFKKAQPIENNATAQLVPTDPVTPPQRFSETNREIIKGDKHNGRKSHRERVSSKRKNEGSPSDAFASQGLPSIYQEEQHDGQQQSGTVSNNEVVSEGLAQSQPALQSKTIHGLPVQAWLRSRQSSLPIGPNPLPAPGGIRVFVGCMEVNNHMSALEKRDCEKVLAAKRVREITPGSIY